MPNISVFIVSFSLCVKDYKYLKFVYAVCFVDMHLYSNNSSTKAMFSSLIMSELFPACFSSSNNFNPSHSSLGSDDGNLYLRKIFL